ncbi:MAG: DUF2721 domain-containing protein [Gammaproteobacteria bacterium]|jgi:hypothetical protein
MDNSASIETIAGVISLAVAPVFLLAGIAGLLGVMSTRLGRITDRARVIEGRIPGAAGQEKEEILYDEATSLWERTHIINWAIRLCTLAALAVCLVIVTLFVGQLVAFNVAVAVAVLFVAAMLFVISGLVLFLLEVGIATGRMRLGMEATLSNGSPAGVTSRGTPPDAGPHP